jgi:hypothetical protein
MIGRKEGRQLKLQHGQASEKPFNMKCLQGYAAVDYAHGLKQAIPITKPAVASPYQGLLRGKYFTIKV